MKIVFLGTGAGLPSKQRNVSSLVLEMPQVRQASWMFDCGEATQHQMLHTSIRPGKIEKIWVTHMHGDHIFGLPGFLSSRSFQGGESSPLTIYGPKGIKEYVETSLSLSGTHLSYPLHFVEIIEDGLLFEDDQIMVFSKRLSHGVPCFGYRIEEKDRPGELIPEKLKAIGIQPGPIYRQIKEQETIELDDGTILKQSEFVGPKKKGRIISILGDTRFPFRQQSFVENSDLLVHEATFSPDDVEIAHQYFHSTVKQAAELASSSHVKRLLLNHISSRYVQDLEIQQLEKEAQLIFPNSKVTYDFYEESIPIGRSEKHEECK
ncbi:ribonuclease Z [Bacillaceae bacterium S4-13-56]